MRNNFPIVEVEWFDAMTYCRDLTNIEEVKELEAIPAKTAGYLMVKNRDFVVIGMTIFVETKAAEKSHKQFWTIPRGCIKKITYLREDDETAGDKE